MYSRMFQAIIFFADFCAECSVLTGIYLLGRFSLISHTAMV
jgi:hypothetical protein